MRPPRLFSASIAALVLGACARAPQPPGVDSLAGLTLALKPGPGLKLWVEGQVGERAADVQLDVTAPISFVTPSCLDDHTVVAHVEVDDPLGPTENFPVTRVEGLTLSGVRFRTFDAAMAGGRGCVVVLGLDVLGALAIDVSPARRELTLRPSQPRAAWEAEVKGAGVEAQVLDLTRDPRHDWPLLPVRFTQGPRAITWTVVLSSRDAHSRLFFQSAKEAELRLGTALLEGLVSDGGVLPSPFDKLSGVAFESLELAPGFGVTDGVLELEPGVPLHGLAGLLGADVWGRFDAALDVKAGVLVLRRPRLSLDGRRAQCEGEGRATEERCFELHTRRDERGTLLATAMVWRPLSEGARLLLEVPGAAASRCRVGFSFPAGDRGRSAQHAFPWDRLVASMPECAAALAAAPQLHFGLYEEEPMRECPGLCVFAQELNTGRISCECQPGPAGLEGVSEHQVLELYRRARKGSAVPMREVEPADP